MLKRIIKTGVAATLHKSGANSIIRAMTAGTRPLVLGYHMVVEDLRPLEGRAIPANLISVRMLERQLDWIGRRYRFLTLDELGARLESGEPLSEPSAVVTFDDGYAGVYHHAWPLLRRKGIPAAAFVVTDILGRTRLQLYDKLYLVLMQALPALRHSLPDVLSLLRSRGVPLAEGLSPDRLRDVFAVMRHLYTTCDQQMLRHAIEAFETIGQVDDSKFPELHAMTWEMVLNLDRGGMTIGSHTHTHALLTIEEPARVAEQLETSSLALQRNLGRPVRHFAYPDGRFDPDVVSAVEQAGYRFAFTTCRHRDAGRPRLTIPRTLLWERSCLNGQGGFSADLMSCHAAGVFERWARCRHARAAGHRNAAPAGLSARPHPGGDDTGRTPRAASRVLHV